MLTSPPQTSPLHSTDTAMDTDSVLQGAMSGNLPIVWSDQPQTMKDILDETSLPTVVKVWQENRLLASLEGANDIHKPLIVYKEMRGRKIYAKNVTSVDVLAGAPCKDKTPIVVIPVSYKGWFRLIDDLEMPMKTVASVARVMPVRMLSAKFVPGFVLKEPPCESEPEGLYQRVEVQPGVLRVFNIHEDYIRYNNYRKLTRRKLLRCLRCIMDDNTEVLLPFDAEGLFYMIEARKTTSKHINVDDIAYVYSINDLLSAGLAKGVFIKLLHGRPPSKPCSFTSVLQIHDVIKDHTIVACTMDEKKSLLELPVANVPLFVKALNTTDLCMNGLYAETLSHLQKTAENYTTEMKVRYHYSVETSSEKGKGKD
ncbi:uncharacterized protein LOC110448781 [Mizuhopecten yessoensis]|uniref:uncharacterized protein LOC110448781 n=1 Tax=Mizuhopecten yessoensis TaxID=6573 RepID=UPI000B45CB8E|nr:uncharacterized protein LOC110448781 [Mizuhopecten yessoensis]